MKVPTVRNPLTFLLLTLFCCPILAWDNEELEMFDLVEEVNENFYTVMGIDQGAPTSDVRKAYRKLSLIIHPDKNKEEDADVKFRQLTAIYEILKDKERRQQYDLVLEQGLPDWRQPVFYYRRVRKLGLLEIAVLLLLIFTIGHFLVMWAAYIERRFVAEELFNDRKKKKEKKRKARQAAVDDDEDELKEQLNTIPRPTLVDLLPIKLSRSLVWLVISLPAWWKDYQEEKRRIKEEEEAERLMQQEIEEELKAERERVKVKRVRKRVVDLPEKGGEEEEESCAVAYTPVGEGAMAAAHEEERRLMQQQRTGEWTAEDYQLLAKACTRYPGGTVNRWEKMASMLNRPVKEVIKKVAERKGGYVKTVDTAAQGITGAIDETAPKKKVMCVPKDGVISMRDNLEPSKPKKTKPPPKTAERTLLIQETTEKENKDKKEEKREIEKEEKESKDEWTQNQQKIFEWGLSNFPKGTAERWEKIAEHIPGKDKDDCILRFKYLAELVRKKKQQQT